MKTLIIDGQLFQTSAWYRGMGGYARKLLGTYITGSDAPQKCLIILNSNLPTDQSREDAIKAELPGADIHYVSLPVDPGVREAEYTKQAKATLTEFVHSHCPDTADAAFLLPAQFTFNYCAVFPDGIKKLLIFYDLIPILYWEYFAQFFPPHLYFARLKQLFEADVIFSISKTTARDLLVQFGIDERKLVVIDGSVNHKAGETTPNTEVLERHGLTKQPFILMPTGGLKHKNNVRAVQAFMQMREPLGQDVKLVITSSFYKEFERLELADIAGDDLIFPGNIPDEEMAALYQQCTAVLMPSLYEGLGIPVLEGIVHDKPVACSDIGAFQEIPDYKKALYVFNPYDVNDMADQIFKAVARAGFAQKQALYPGIMQKYDWKRSAELFYKGATHPVPERPAITHRIAVVCPDPRKDNAAGRFAQRMYGYALQQGVELVYFIDPGKPGVQGAKYPDYVRSIAQCFPIEELYAHDFATTLHFISNDPQFAAVTAAALARPGVLYAGQADYLPAVTALHDKGYISDSQYAAEQRMQASGIIAVSKALVVEQHAQSALQAALKQYKIEKPQVVVPDCQSVNDAPDAEVQQLHTYKAIIDFIKVNHEQ